MRSDSLVKLRASAVCPHLQLNPSKGPLGTILGTVVWCQGDTITSSLGAQTGHDWPWRADSPNAASLSEGGVLRPDHPVAQLWHLLLVLTWAGLSGDPYLFTGLVVLIAFFADAGWVVWCSFRLGKNSLTRFLTAACVTGVYLGVGIPAISLREFRSAQQQEKQRAGETISSWRQRDTARSAVECLTGFLIQYRENQPTDEFPQSLTNLPIGLRLANGKVCDPDLAKPGALSDYTISYTPEPDPASGKITDFRLLAMPGRKGLDYVNPMLSDSRGRIFVYERWFATEQGEHLEPMLTEQPDDWVASRVLALGSSVRFAMKNKGMERPPSSLSELQLSTSPEEGGSSPNTLSAVCQSYAISASAVSSWTTMAIFTRQPNPAPQLHTTL
jgi:hypothetical protein